MCIRDRGNFGVLLDRANLLDGSKDDLGYMRLREPFSVGGTCLLYTSDAADDLLCVDLGGRRIIKKKT